MIDKIQAGVALFFAIPLITMLDFLIFRRSGSCEVCGQKAHPMTWLVATTLEVLMFIAGLYIGMS